ncbi:MAG: insulinase family protein [Planctomycetota bacterium]|nr:insulinase family protein [Planctomycetota bacterium]
MAAEELFFEKLPSGIRLAGHRRAGCRTAAVLLRYFFGTRDEPGERLGITRVAAACLFKGTARKTARELSDGFDAVGARRGTAVGVEYVDFGATVPAEGLERTLELYAEAFGEAVFGAEGCREAKASAIQAIRAIEDDPSAKLFSLLWRKALGPRLGRDELGRLSTVSRLSAGAVAGWWRQNAKPGRLLVSVAGGFDRPRIAGLVERLFGRIGRGGTFGQPPAFRGVPHAAAACRRKLAQQHIAICFRTAPRGHKLYYAAHFLTRILGGGGSSRLFQRIRDRGGLAYNVLCGYLGLRGAGCIYAYAATSPGRAAEVFDMLCGEIADAGINPLPDEVERARAGMLAASCMSWDAVETRVATVASQATYDGRVAPLEEMLEEIRQVSPGDIRACAEEFPPRPLTVVTLGPAAFIRRR